jgi:hypothetical protein
VATGGVDGAIHSAAEAELQVALGRCAGDVLMSVLVQASTLPVREFVLDISNPGGVTLLLGLELTP